MIKVRRALLACGLTVAISSIQAADAWTWQGSAGLAAGNFDYEETGNAGRRLNREHGTLPGLSGALHGTGQGISVGLDFYAFAGDVSYDGQTNAGAPIRTRTDQRIADGSGWIGMRALDSGVTHLDVFAGAGLRWWNRDIRSTATAFGLDETYTWPYALAGVRTERRLTHRDRLGVDLRLLRPIAPELRIDFKNGYDAAQVEPAAKTGGRLALSWTRFGSQRRDFSVTLHYERWRLDDSDATSLRRNGAVIGSVLEPASRSEFIGITCAVRAPIMQ